MSGLPLGALRHSARRCSGPERTCRTGQQCLRSAMRALDATAQPSERDHSHGHDPGPRPRRKWYYIGEVPTDAPWKKKEFSTCKSSV